MEKIRMNQVYDLRHLQSEEQIINFIKMIGAFGNNEIKLYRYQLTSSIENIANIKNIKMLLYFSEPSTIDLYKKNLYDALDFNLETIWEDKLKTNLPTNVFFNDKKKATTLMFYDTATVVKCGKDDKYSRRIGFLEAYFQATCGLSKTQAKKYLDKIVEDKEVKKK